MNTSVLRVLERGCFGITYLAKDQKGDAYGGKLCVVLV
ncbi:hypothetical protein COO91_04926 [Nostoc flagelliforme CCNUN1]|uniref:Serine/threonine protein kinase n=1 Tax=Nostoc flagelliforme CCNUN1 TaxID=2038116 RepID=A0A2K8SU16_9NOSO|nr:hypothetical protein COO91_04926 [Nostoc flagelliforme CCNUN1]